MLRRLIIVVLMFVLIVGGLIWAINRRGRAPEQDREVRTTQLVDYANTTTEVKYILRGPINALENHRIIEITVSRNSRSAVILEGYNRQVLKSENYTNTQESYIQFLAALQNFGYTNTRIYEQDIQPEGACPQGRRADFEIIQGSEKKQSLWTTSCNQIGGTFAGRTSDIRSLFADQLPDYNEFVQDVQL